ncbi:hypothetical protein H4696_003740 [Amycolatopsis lexingtonensis]|uniref:PknH-like extracellular domain-containing protein n=1 Tax=Amycolatopsis lexingtonensis TaxID=218822 RepID=A0ABR9I0F8_9PSEU|nr:hypothetical protein [Amycolatopsis lexingtonensis]MBE1496640.1 hypothetical protein [Amycolatopsis lexingtonensis]
MRTARIAAALVVAALGCGIALSAGDAAEPGPPPIGPVHAVASGADVVLPFDAYRHSAAEVNVIERATALLARDCLARFGYLWAPPSADAVDAFRPAAGGRYGIVDAAEVARLGYHPVEPPDRPAEPQPPLDVLMVYTGKGTSEAHGQPVPDGGCLGEARRRLEEGVPAALPGEAFARLDRELFLTAQADPRVQAAMAGWRGCMAESGERYADVWAANDDVRWSGPSPTPEEIRVARADLACRARTGLAGTWLAVETAYQRRAIEERSGEFEALAKARQVRLTTAWGVVDR